MKSRPTFPSNAYDYFGLALIPSIYFGQILLFAWVLLAWSAFRLLVPKMTSRLRYGCSMALGAGLFQFTGVITHGGYVIDLLQPAVTLSTTILALYTASTTWIRVLFVNYALLLALVSYRLAFATMSLAEQRVAFFLICFQILNLILLFPYLRKPAPAFYEPMSTDAKND